MPAVTVQNHKWDGLQKVVEAFQPALLRYASRLLSNETLAQDVVQNAWIKLSRREPPPDGPNDEIRNWLFRVTHNEAVDLIRSEESKRRAQERFARQQASETGPGRGVDDTGTDDRAALVLSCLPALTPLQRQVVLLRLQQGLNYETIGKIIGEKSGYVGNLLHHAVKALAAEVKRREGGTGHVSS